MLPAPHGPKLRTVHGWAIVFLAFAVTLGSEVVLAIQRPDQIWYEGRAAVESVNRSVGDA
jgi:hypothetical protein